MKAHALPSLKGRYPVCLCAPSFLYRAGWAHNVERLRSVVDEVELLFFESAGSCSLPAGEEISRIASFAAPAGLKLDVHLPLDIDIASADPRVAAHARDTVSRVIDLAEPIAPRTFILHVPRSAGDDTASWRVRVRESLALLPAPRSRFAVETLDWDLRDAAAIFQDLGFSICIDIGHLLVAGRDVGAFFETFRGSITMVHLHGVQGPRDHLPLFAMDAGVRADIRSILKAEKYAASLSLEVFSLEDFRASLPALEEMLSW
jgi:sugar phosphate isomerase/epimerase